MTARHFSARDFTPFQLGAAGLTTVSGLLPFLLLSVLFDPSAADPALRWTSSAKWLSVPWTSWLAVAYLGWIATLWAYAMWTGLLKRHPANRVAPFSLGVPVVGLNAGMLALALACVMFGDRILAKSASRPC